MPVMTLDTVEEAFIAWRKNRSSRTEPIPQSLWERIFHIYHDYSLAETCRRLRLNKTVANIKIITVSLSSASRRLSVSLGINDIAHVLPHFGTLL